MPTTGTGAAPGAPVPMMGAGMMPAQPAVAPYGATPPLPNPALPNGSPPAVDFGGGADNGFSPQIQCGDPQPAPVTHFWTEFEWVLWWFKQRQLPPLVTQGNPSDVVPGALGQPGTTVIFGNNGSDTNPYNGFRFWAGYYCDDAHCFGIEGNFFVLENRVARTVISSNGDPGTPLFARPFSNVNLLRQDADPIAVPGVMAGTIIFAQPRQLYGSEVNVRLSTGTDQFSRSRWSFLVGGRYLNLNEKFETNEALSDIPGLGAAGFNYSLDEHFSTSNYFWGGQVGLGWDWSIGDVFVGIDYLVAVGRNHEKLLVTGGTSATSQADGTVTLGPNRALLVMPSNVGLTTDTVTSVVQELTFHLGYNFNKYVNISVGYNFLYWNKLLQPNDQLDTAINIQKLDVFDQVGPARPAPRFQQSNMWVHGLTLSLGISF
jgi:hypothetical protein